MFKQIITAVMILLQCTALLMPYRTLLDFQLRREYISQNLCENLDKGITACRGSCYLEKKIEDEKNEPDNTERVTLLSQKFNAHYCKNLVIPVIRENHHEKTSGFFYQENYLFQFIANIFHPPKAGYDWDHISA